MTDESGTERLSLSRRAFLGVAGLTVAALSGASGRAGALAPSGLMCDLLARPERTEIINPRPRFSWVVNSDAADDAQTAYQIRLAATVAGLEQPSACLWDTGKVASDRSAAVEYAGKPLNSHASCCWQVRTWGRRGGPSAWSPAQEFRTGDLGRSSAGADPLDRRVTVARYPVEQTPIAPVSVVETGPGHYFLDFGRDAFAGLRLTLASPRAGLTARVHMGEALDGPQRVNRAPGGSVRYHTVELPLTMGTHTYEVPLPDKDRRRMPDAVGAVMPFRYVEVEDCPAALTAADARQTAVHYPFDEGAARFVSSDAALNAVWDLCRYTMKATSFCGVYVDGDRERLPYEADAYINQLGHYACDREFTLARYSHEFLLLRPTWPTEWILHSVLMAWADYLYTGDDRSLAEFYGDLQAKTLSRLARPDGLVSAAPPVPPDVLASVHGHEMRDIVDWPPPERDGCEMRPVNTVVNAFHYRALVLMGEIADALRRPDDARSFRRQADTVAASFNATLFDAASGLYVDGEGSAHSSLHANMFALAFGLVPAGRREAVAAFVRGKGMACSVYGAQYLLEACYAAGMADHALALLTATDDRGWVHMIRDVGTTMTTEAWDVKDKPNQDWNHAWGAAPANIIPRLLMGVEPVAPGFRTARIRPQPGGLARASLDLPTVRGAVHVEFESAPTRFALRVRLPANMTANVSLPLLASEDPTVLVDGRPRWGTRDGAFVVVEGIGSGAHRLERRAGA